MSQSVINSTQDLYYYFSSVYIIAWTVDDANRIEVVSLTNKLTQQDYCFESTTAAE